MKSAMQQPPQCSQGLPTAKPKVQIVGDNDEGQRYIDPFQGKVNKDYSDLLQFAISRGNLKGNAQEKR